MLVFQKKLRLVVLIYVPLAILLALAAMVLAEQRSGRTTASNALDTALMVCFFTAQVVAFLYAVLVRPTPRAWPIFDFDRLDNSNQQPQAHLLVPPPSTRMLFRRILRWNVLVFSPLCACLLGVVLADEGAWLDNTLYEWMFSVGLLTAVLNIPAALLYAGLVKPPVVELASSS